MASYMILKPVRDALPSEWGDVSRATQWTYTFIASSICVFIYDLCAAKVSLRRLVPGVFVAFSLSFLVIYLCFKAGFQVPLLGKVFYVWTSVFSLFHISVFWSFVSQHYSKTQSKRVFGFINTGASAGAIAGPLLVILLAKNMSIENVLLITSGILLVSLPIIRALNRHFEHLGETSHDKPELSHNSFAGLQAFSEDRRLIGIALFILFFTGVSTFFYTTQSDLLADYTRTERKQFLGSVDLVTNALTICIGLFATNRLLKKFGLAASLSMVPFAIAGLMLLLSLNPTALFILSLVVVRRAGNYAITKPSREVLFTSVAPEVRFKTKPFLDVVVYRGGDVFWIWSIAFLGDGYLDLSMKAKIIAGAVVAIIWGVIGLRLGKKFE